jgi:hypothetical protein
MTIGYFMMKYIDLSGKEKNIIEEINILLDDNNDRINKTNENNEQGKLIVKVFYHINIMYLYIDSRR